jgi:hypothetical protein
MTSVKWGTVLRIGARVLGLLDLGVWLVFALADLFAPTGPPTTTRVSVEGMSLMVILCAFAFAFILAWWREGQGGALLLAVGLAFGAFAYTLARFNNAKIAVISGGPVLLVGGLFLGARALSRDGTHVSRAT